MFWLLAVASQSWLYPPMLFAMVFPHTWATFSRGKARRKPEIEVVVITGAFITLDMGIQPSTQNYFSITDLPYY